MLVLLATAARARLVWLDLVGTPLRWLRGGIFRGIGGYFSGGNPSLHWLLCHRRLDSVHGPHDVALDVLLELAEHPVTFGLVDDKGILLTVGLKTNALAQVVHGGQ